MIVLDASAALTQALPTQTTAAADHFFETLSGGIAPAILGWEARHALLKAERQKRINVDQLHRGVLIVDELARRAIWDDSPASFMRLMSLARTENLSLFDAAYLDLAITERAGIASRDAGLIEAAKRRRVEVVDLR